VTDKSKRVSAFSVQILSGLLSSVAEEMGTALQRSGFSPNIKERRDYSCAVFDSHGHVIAQASHIPAHLGAMPSSVDAARNILGDQPKIGDMVILNDPDNGGTHLPDITTVSPVFSDSEGMSGVLGFLATRAHHSDVGGMSPGSMPIANEIFQEGLIIPPVFLCRAGKEDSDLLALIYANVRTPRERKGDLLGQIGAHRIGEQRMFEIVGNYGESNVRDMFSELIQYSKTLTKARLSKLPIGEYCYTDYLDDDGFGEINIPISLKISITGEKILFDFSGSAECVNGCVNAPMAVTLACVYYVLRCVIGSDVPANSGMYDCVDVIIPELSVLNPGRSKAVAGGNVETSQRVTDVIWGALSQVLPEMVPAAGTGSMNNLSFGGRDCQTGDLFAYYETMGGGAGGGPNTYGASGIHVSMSNTRNTPVEALEFDYPVMVERYELRSGSGGGGINRGGLGLRRDIRALNPMRVSLLTERRSRAPYGLNGGEFGETGKNRMFSDGRWSNLPAKCSFDLAAGEIVSVSSAGGGGWGSAMDPTI